MDDRLDPARPPEDGGSQDRPFPRSAVDPFSRSHKLERLVWQVCWLLLAAWTPSFFHAWRRTLLRAFGATMGRTADVRGGARVWYPRFLTMETGSILANGVNCYNQAPVRIGSGVVVSQGAHLCAGSHHVDDPDFTWFAREIVIEPGAWIAAEAFVGPGVRIGRGSVLGARAVAFRSIPANEIHTGNPARCLRIRQTEADHAG